jgi:hypothetical protein
MIKRALSEDFSSAYFRLMFLTLKDTPQGRNAFDNFELFREVDWFVRLTTVISNKNNCGCSEARIIDAGDIC